MVKSLLANAADLVSGPRPGRSPGGGSGNPLQYSCLENPMDIGTWRAAVHGVAESDTTEQLSRALEKTGAHCLTTSVGRGVRDCFHLEHLRNTIRIRWTAALYSCTIWMSFCFFIFLNNVMYLFLVVLGVRCCARALSSCSEQGLLLVTVHGPLVGASLVGGHGL